MNKKRLFAYLLFLTLISPFIIILICNHLIIKSAEGRLFSTAQEIPFNRVGILLGIYKFSDDGSVNAAYVNRIQAAAELIKAGKIKYLIASGRDNTKGYNEPVMMRDNLQRQGIDTSIVYLNYAGFRTFDSMVRLKEVFGQDAVTVISQKYHNERALYIALKEGITAIGFNAKDNGVDVYIREKLARVKVFVDYFTNKQPRQLVEKVSIPVY